MKLSAVFGRRDIAIGMNVAEAMCRVAPDKDAKDIASEVMKSTMRGREAWDNKILPEMYGPDKAEKIRTKLNELVTELPEAILIGGNHLASSLIALGCMPAEQVSYDSVRALFGQQCADMWVCWKAIMDNRGSG